MCNRYVQTKRAQKRAELLAQRMAVNLPDVTESWNVAPTSQSLIVRRDQDGALRDVLHWGLQDREQIPKHFNARLETAAKLPTFRESWPERRCIVPVDGWYDWMTIRGEKQPYYFQQGDGSPAFLAGLWERRCFCILTMDAEELNAYHSRRPVVFDLESANAWLLGMPVRPEEVAKCSMPASAIAVHPVSRRVNKVGNDGADLVNRVKVPKPASEQLDFLESSPTSSIGR